MQRLWTRNFIFITISTFFVFFNLQMITPSLSSFINHNIGGNSVIGLSNAIWAISAIITRTMIGRTLQTGNKKRLLWIAFLIYIVATVAYVFATSVPILIAVRILYGVGFGLTTTTLGTLVAEAIPALRMGEGMGYFGLSTSLAMAIAPIVGISLYNGLGFKVMILIITVLMLFVGASLPFIRQKKSTAHTNDSVSTEQKRRWTVSDFYDPAVLLPCLLLLLLSITYGGVISFITLFGSQLHIANVGWFFLIDAAAILLVRPFAGRIYDRSGHMSVIPFGAVFVCLGLVLLSYSSNMLLFFLSAICYGLGYGVLQPALQTWMFQRLPAHRRGIASGAFYSSMDLGIALGSLILGYVSDLLGYGGMYRVAAGCLVLLLVIYGSVMLKSRRTADTQLG